jgi:hypothetical protein
MTLRIVLALALVAGAGCDKKKVAETPATPGAPAAGAEGQKEGMPAAATPAAPAAPAAPKYADTTALWAMAPPEATFGFVVGDGVGPRALDLVNRARKKLEGKPFAAKVLAEIDGARKEAPFDVFDAAAYKANGWDITKGLAVFGGADTSKPLLFVVPVSDINAVKKLMPDMKGTVEKVGDREVFKGEDAVCSMAGDRYVCAATLELVDAAVKPHDSPLAAAVKALPAEARGDVEGYVDIAKTPSVASEMDDLKQLGDFTHAGGSLRLDLPGANLHLWGKGTMTPMAAAFASTAPPAELAGMTANATTVMRAKIDPKVLLAQAPPSLPLGDADVRTDLLDQLTGDVQAVTAGKGILAGALMLKITDAAKVKKVVAAACAEAQKQGTGVPVQNVVAKEDSCTGEISLAMLKDMIGVELAPFKFNFSVGNNLLVAAFGDLDPASLKGSVADETGSAEAKDALTGAQTAALWTRGVGFDLTALPKPLVDKALADKEVADAVSLMNWGGAQVYELSAAASLSSTHVKLTVHATSMEADPAEAKAAFDAALEKRLAGDAAGYTAALADIEKKHPGTLAAKRAKLERIGTPVAGPLTGVVAGAGAAFAMFARGLGEAVAPTTGGSFGEPGAPATPPADEKPAEEPAKPAEEAPKPAAEPAKPAEEAPKPAAEPAKPAEEPKPAPTP